MTLHALAVLCGLAAPVFAAAPGFTRWPRLSVAASAFVILSVWFWSGRVPDVARIGTVLAVFAAAQLVWPYRVETLSPLAAGAAAAVVLCVLRYQGMPLPAAATVATLPSIASFWLAARRSHFAPPILRDEALLLVVALGLIVAMVPGLADGWRSALALNASSAADTTARPLPLWTMLASSGAIALGGCYSAWRHR